MFISNIIHFAQKTTTICDSNISGTFKPHFALCHPIMNITRNKGCGVALLNNLRHSSCLDIIFVIFCNNFCQVSLWQFVHWHIAYLLLVPIIYLPQGRLTFPHPCDRLDCNQWYKLKTWNIMTRLDPCYPLCAYYEYVPQPSAWTRAYLHICSCTLWISNTYAHDPHHMHISSRLSIMPIC